MFRGRWPISLSRAAALTLAIGMAGTAIMFFGLRRLEHDKAELEFRQRASARIIAVRQQMDETVQVVRVINQLFTTFGMVDREQFRRFTEPLLKRYPYVQAFNFHRIVPDSERQEYEAQMRIAFPHFALRQLRQDGTVTADAREHHLVVDYIEPMAGNEAAFGLDVSSNKGVMAAVGKAIDSGEAVSSELVVLAQGGGATRGFLMLMPVYRQGMPIDSAEARRRAVIGDTAAVFKASSLIEKLLRANGFFDTDSMAISVYAGSVVDERNLVFRRGMDTYDIKHSWLPHWLLYDSPDRVVHDFNVAGRPWHMVATATPVFFNERHSGSLSGLIGGVLLSLFATAYVQAISSRSRRVQQLVDQRTQELREANDMLLADIAARKRAEEGQQLLQRAIEASANAVIITSAAPPDYPIEYVNPAFERMTGYTSSEVTGRSCSLLWGEDYAQDEVREIRAAVRELRESHVVMRTYDKGGQLFWSDVYIAPVRDDAGNVNHYVVAMYDITANKRYQAELEFQANRDTLTGLANRSLLHDRLQQTCAYVERYGHSAWVLFINLDRFKFVNDTLGHKAGDRMLKEVADRLRVAVRDTDTVARLSADEFVLILSEQADEALSPAFVQRIMDAIARPVSIQAYEFVVNCSIGVAVCPGDGKDAETLLKHAGVAMYRAKEVGRNNFQFFAPSMNEHAMERLRIEGDLRNALERDEFVLHYQPQIDSKTGTVLGVEALLRWRHPALGMVPPVRFIGLAEETGLIVSIGDWVLRTACQQSVAWQRAGLGAIRVAVNLSPRQFYDRDLVGAVRAALDDTGIAPHLLELELTESMMMNDVEHAAGILRRLKALGVHLSIDDFGTGYSSLAYLKRFPIDVLKIDQSFVRDISVDPNDAAIVQSIISLAHSLRLKVVAEGVETEAELEFLRRHGCDFMQGYYFGRPVEAGECEGYLQRCPTSALAAPTS